MTVMPFVFLLIFQSGLLVFQPRYRDYCVSRFGFLIDRPAIFDDENEDYALSRCREIWELRYPSEPFDLEISTASEEPPDGGDVLARIRRHASLAANFSDPFMAETVYLVAAKRRYLDFLRLVKSLPANGFRLVPTSDVLLMWLTHQVISLQRFKAFFF